MIAIASVGGLLALVCLALKLMHVVTWPWVWALSPVWITWILLVVYLFGIGLLEATKPRAIWGRRR